MTPEQREALASAVEALPDAAEPYSFLYCAEDGDGEPTLILSEGPISPMVLLGLLRSAKDKAFLRGTAAWQDGAVVFTVPDDEKPSFAVHLAGALAEAAPGLAGAQIALEQEPEIDAAFEALEHDLEPEEPPPPELPEPLDDEDFSFGGAEPDEADPSEEPDEPAQPEEPEEPEEPQARVIAAPRPAPRPAPAREVVRRGAPAAADPAAAAKRRFDSAEAAVIALEEGMLGRNAAAVLSRHRAAVEALAKAAVAAGVFVPAGEGDTKAPLNALASHAKAVKSGVDKFKLVARSRDIYDFMTLEAPIEPVTALADLGVTERPRAEAWTRLYEALAQLCEAHKAVLYQLETWSDRLSEDQLSILDGNHAALEGAIRDHIDLVLILARPVAEG